MSRRTSSTHMAPPVTAYSSFIRGASPLGLPDTLSRPSTSLRTTLSLRRARSPLRGPTAAHRALSDVEGRRRASASAKATARPRRSASREGGPFAGLAPLRSLASPRTIIAARGRAGPLCGLAVVVHPRRGQGAQWSRSSAGRVAVCEIRSRIGAMRHRIHLVFVIAGVANVLAAQQPRALVIDHARVVDGTGATPIDDARIVVRGDRIVEVGRRASVAAPADAEVVDLSGRTVLPGLIDLHFHIENDPKLALRQLSHGVTSFRDPGQWEEKFVGLRRMIADDHLAAPRIFTAGPHIDGEHPAYPADAVVARDPEEARRFAERNLDQGASSLKIYFRLPFASARAVIDVCNARHVPCTAHLEITDARELLLAGLQGVEDITSLRPSLLPRVQPGAYRQRVLADNDARRDGRYEMFAHLPLDGPDAEALYEV